MTGNNHKVAEARERLAVPVEQVRYDYQEIQADDIEPIAIHGATEAFDHLGGETPVFVEDSGLFVDALGGFPGPYSAYVEATVGIEGVWTLVADREPHSARFVSVIAYVGEDTVETFRGEVEGTIVPPRGSGGFGYDPIFEVDGRTMAEMSTAEKNDLSHRGRALDAFAAWHDS